MARRVNADGLKLITSFEGFEPKWYRDPVGIWTIGFGHTDAAGAPKHATSNGLVLSAEAATEILANDLGQYAEAVERAVKVPLNDNQFAALVSFTYNVGAGALAKSTLVKKLNTGNYGAVRSELAKWNKAGGKVMKGLTRRRTAEADLFEAKEATPAPVQPSPAPKPAEPVKRDPEPRAGGFLAILISILKAIFRGGQK